MGPLALYHLTNGLSYVSYVYGWGLSANKLHQQIIEFTQYFFAVFLIFCLQQKCIYEFSIVRGCVEGFYIPWPGPWHFWYFCCIFLQNVSEVQKSKKKIFRPMFAAFSDSNKNEDKKRGRFIYTPGHLTLGAIVPHGKFVTVVALFCIKKN